VSNTHPSHPDDGALLRYADGELSAAEAKQVRAHLAACWRCRNELAELQQTIRDCVRYHETVVRNCLPEPPAPWFDIYRRFEQIDAESPPRPLFERLAAGLRRFAAQPRRWAPATAVLVVALVVVDQLSNAPSVRAAELLRKAAAAERARPRGPRHIEFRTASATLTRVIGGEAAPAEWEAEAGLASLRPLFEEARYDWNDPLSAASFARWRNSLPEKHDEVVTVRDRYAPERKCYRIRTTTNSSVLVEATLNLTVAELRPVEGTMRFRNNQWVEMRELPPPVAKGSIEEGPRTAEKLTSSAKPEPAREPVPREIVEPVSPAEELMVLAVLHSLGADLGEPVQVAREGGRLSVTGYGVTPEIAEQIRHELAGIPGVEVRFDDAAAVGMPPAGEARRGEVTAVRETLLQRAVEEQLGGRTAFEQFSEGLLAIDEELMARAYALQRLAQHFPPEKEAQLDPEDRDLLARLRRDHAEPLAGLAASLEEQVRPVLEGLAAAPDSVPGLSAAASWQDATEILLETARRADYWTAVLLGGAAADQPLEEAAAEAAAAFAQLRLQAAEYVQHAVE